MGILDVDLCGPSIPKMLRVCRPEVHQCETGWVPVYADAQQTLALMSIGFLLEHPDEAVVWRGPKKTGVNQHSPKCTQLLSKTHTVQTWHRCHIRHYINAVRATKGSHR